MDWGFGLGAFGMFFLYDWNRVFLKKEWYMPASPQELRNNLYGSFLAHFFWLY